MEAIPKTWLWILFSLAISLRCWKQKWSKRYYSCLSTCSLSALKYRRNRLTLKCLLRRSSTCSRWPFGTLRTKLRQVVWAESCLIKSSWDKMRIIFRRCSLMAPLSSSLQIRIACCFWTSSRISRGRRSPKQHMSIKEVLNSKRRLVSK